MASPGSPIDAYIHRLDRELRIRRAPRRRLLAEVLDHLCSSVDELVSQGRATVEAERESVARFGAAVDVARGFAHAAASSTTRVAAVWAGGAFVAYAVTAMLYLIAAPTWLRDFPQGAPTMLALQLATVALAVTAVRALRWRRVLVIDEERLRLVANGALTAALAVSAGAGAELLLALTRPAAAPWAEVTPLIAAFALAVLVSLPAALVAAAGYARASGLGALPGRRAGNGLDELTLADDLGAIMPALGGLARAALRRPAWTCALLAAGALVAVALAQPTGNGSAHPSIAVGALAVGAFEAAAIVIGYLTLGRPLGLRRPRRASA